MKKLKVRKPNGSVTQEMLGEAMEYVVERVDEMMDEKLEKRFREELGPVSKDIHELKGKTDDILVILEDAPRRVEFDKLEGRVVKLERKGYVAV